jgi:hypothetical protein
MPIPVVCPGCKAAFNVSDKFAGKQGPCPKCKTPINIPKIDPKAPPKEEIKIHAPDEATSGPKGASGRPVLKPIERSDAKLSPVISGIVVLTIVAMFAGAWLGGDVVKRPYQPPAEVLVNEAVAAEYQSGVIKAYSIRAVALALIAVPIIWAGYLILRDDELAPFRGSALWYRVGICFAIYMLLWGVYGLIPFEYASRWYVTAAVAIPLFAIGFATAYFTFEFDPTSATVHLLSFIAVTLLLGLTAGLTMPWSDSLQTLPPAYQSESEEMPIYDSYGQPFNDAAKKIEREKTKKPSPTATRPATP